MRLPHITAPGSRQFLLTVLLSLVLLGLCANSAFGQSDLFEGLTEEEALFLVRSMDAAEQAEELGQWLAAAEIYLNIWERLPIEEYRFRQAYSLEQARRYREALGIYQELVESEREEIVAAAQQRVSALEEQLADLPGLLQIETNLGALITVDDSTNDVAVDGTVEFEVSEGTHIVTVQLEGYQPDQTEITLEPGEVVELTILLSPIPSPLPDEPSLLAPILLGSLAVAATGTGIVFWVLANDAEQEAWDYDYDGAGASGEAELLLNDRAEDFELVTNISFIAAGALAVGAIVTFVLTQTSDSETIDVPITLETDGESIATQLRLRF